jgi:hypothetical protein
VFCLSNRVSYFDKASHAGFINFSASRKAKTRYQSGFLLFGGEKEIRTLEGLLTLAGFQDRCIKPLCHLSVAPILIKTQIKSKDFFSFQRIE